VIRRIRVKNFKSLKDVSVDLGPRNILVGPNMSGKTTFLSIFRFLNRMVIPASGVHGLTHAVTSMGGFAELAWTGEQSHLISISLEGEFPEGEQYAEDETWKYRIDLLSDARGHVSVQEESLVFEGRKGEHPIVQRDSITGWRVLMNREGGRVSEVRDGDRSALEFEIPEWEGNLLRSLFASFRFYNLMPQLMKQVNSTAAAYFLDEGGVNFSAWLLVLQTRFREYFHKINLAASGALPDISGVFTFPTQQATVFIASQEKFLKSPVPVWQMSDGELCFIAWLSLIYCPPELGAPAYFIEEPENHLHPRLVETLVDLLDQVQNAPDLRPSQIFAASHSLTLVDKSALDQIIVFERQEGATVCTRPREKEHLRELIARKEVGLGDLYYSGALGRD
jgi:predicted ATPase